MTFALARYDRYCFFLLRCYRFRPISNQSKNVRESASLLDYCNARTIVVRL
ncbi:hypothetical protein ACPOL_4102 [Acidisarcina polymorpha]|uniref:Uncharacterized protein n=1 Tax=Acidisarcina polymorpha TaxID=2211140 RepID=A0A2Z5G2U9_9BACT|nr:hypothetical protein ACPOL_4102 [Acidisarcina polymorpha]